MAPREVRRAWHLVALKVFDRARVGCEGLRVLHGLEGEVAALALLVARRLHPLALLGALLDVLGHRVESRLVLDRCGRVGVRKELLIGILLEEAPSLVVVGERARLVLRAELLPPLAARLAKVVRLLELLELLLILLLVLGPALNLSRALGLLGLGVGLLLGLLRLALRVRRRVLCLQLVLLLQDVQLVRVDGAVL